MRSINTLPLGFLDLLGLQAQGKNLSEIADFLQGTLDLTPFYAAYKRTFVREDTAFGAVATSSVTVATVPLGEYWFIIGGFMQSLGAAGTGNARVEVVQEGRVLFTSATQSVAAAAINSGQQINFQTAVPLILSPGAVISKFGYGLAALGAETLAVRLAYLPLKG